MKLKTSVYSQFIPIFISFTIYLVLTGFFLYFIKDISKVLVRKEPNTVIEGILLPKVDTNINEILNVDPLLTTSNTDTLRDIRKKVSSLVFSSLFRENLIDLDGIEPDIIESYTFKNAKDLDIKLRNDIKWQDGAPLTSKDVEFTFRSIQSLGQNSGFSGAVNGGDIQIQVINDYQLSITLASSDNKASPNSAYLHELTFPILPAHILENYPKSKMSALPATEFGAHPVGTGALKYILNTGTELTLSKNSDFYKGTVQFDKYILRFYKDYNELVRDFKLKNLDIVFTDGIPNKTDLIDRLSSVGAVRDSLVLRNRKLVLYFNTTKKGSGTSPFIDFITLRRALLNIIDRNKLIQDLGNNGRPVLGPIDQSSWAFDTSVSKKETISPTDFDKIATGLGFQKDSSKVYNNKSGKPLSLTLTYQEGDVNESIVQSIKSQLAQNGVVLIEKKISLNPQTQQNLQSDSFSDIINNRNFDAILTGIDLTQDPDVYSEWHSSKISPPGLNLSGYSNTYTDKTLVDARVTDDRNVRKNEYAKFQVRFFEETPAIYLINPATNVFFSKRITNASMDEAPDVNYLYDDILNWKVSAKTIFN